MDQPTIQCVDICKSYGENDNRIDALKNVSLEIYQGKLTLLVGPSGSGKTTLLSIMTNILTPDKGRLRLLGEDVSHMPDKERGEFCQVNLGIVFQSLFLIPTLTVEENIALPMTVAGKPQDAALAKARVILTQMHLGTRAKSFPNSLSKGQQQRVAIARAIINDARIIICDEPTSALDHVIGGEIMTLLNSLAKNESKTVLVVTHDHRIFQFADRIIHMADGQICSEDPK